MPEDPVFRYNTTFQKLGQMVYISHLDLMTLFRRGLRRAGLPFVLTRGFTPRVKISIPRALKLGAEGKEEAMTLWLKEDVDPDEVMKKINLQLPEGLRIVRVFTDFES